MTRIIFNNTTPKLGVDKNQKQIISNKLISDDIIFKKRSKKYMDLFSSLDHSSLTNTQGINQLLEAIHEEFGTAELANLPIGIMGKCFLGHPHDVHTLDMSCTQIIRHYKISEDSGEFEKARNLARHNAYIFIEVYKDKIILINEDGTPIKV